MRPAIVLLSILACTTPRPVIGPPPADTPVAAPRPPVVDLTGAWATGSANEPPAGPVVLHPPCASNPAVWLIEQDGNALKTWHFPASWNQGIVRPGPGMARLAPTPGTISGADVVIADADTRFELRFDSTSGHLRGKRNDSPFWAARQVVVRTETCPGIP